MYQKGDLKLVDGDCSEMDEDGQCWNEAHSHRVMDSRNQLNNMGVGTLFLKHSCGEWVIGGPEQVKALIEDLQEYLKTKSVS